MNLSSWKGCAASRLAGLLLLAAPILAMAQQAQFPLVTSDDVKKSLEANEAAWRVKIEEKGHPRLLFDKDGVAELKARLMADPRSPEVKALLSHAYELAPSLPHPYVSPEDHVKKGETIFSANGELWIREVGNEITLLAVAAALDPSPVLKKALHDAVIEACRYPTWGRYPGDSNDLSCSHAARGVALAWDWFPDLWSAGDRDVILQAITHRANQLLTGLYGNAYWARTYPDNHNQVNCNGLAWCGLAFYSDIPQAPEWLAAARLDFQNVARYFPEDGSSAEGVPYWSYGMGYVLQYIEGTRLILDSSNLYQAPFLKNAAAFRLNASTSGLGGTLPWGDAPSRDFYGPQHILSRLATEYKDPSAAWLSHKLPWAPGGSVDVFAWMALWQSGEGSMQALPLDYHHWITDMVTTRSGWGPGDYLLAIKSGFNNRNHTHLGAGALALAFGSEWLLTAPGYGTGDKSPAYWDFGNKRWTFYSNATESHSTLLINGQNQRFDSEARGTIDQFFSAPCWSWTSINLTEAYKEVTSVQREVLHHRGDYILVFDSVMPKLPVQIATTSSDVPSIKPSVEVEWLAQFSSEPERQQNSLTVKAEDGQLRVEMLSPAAEFFPRKPTSAIVDARTEPHTYAVKSSGEAVNFIACLQPGFSNGILPELKTTVTEQKPGLTHVVLQGTSWTDDIFKSKAVEPVEMNVKGASPGSGVKSTAKVTAIRTDARGVCSCITLNASTLELPGIVIKPESPANIGLQKMPNGSWIVDADQDLQGRITVAKEFSIRKIEQNKNAFRYLLSNEGTTDRQASEWLASLLLFREKAPTPVRVLAGQPPLPSSVTIPIEAEAFTDQRQGNAEVVEGKPGAVGKSLRGFGTGASNHYVTWLFEVPQAGQYQLTIRYATNLPEVLMGVLVDGAAPAQTLTRLPMPSTGGWSLKENNWKDMVVSDSHGEVFVFNLAKGKHELRLAKPTGGLALDRFEFRGTGK